MLDFAAAAVAVAATQALAAELSPQAIVWFGSAARGQTHPDSDLDFLIVAPRSAGGRSALIDRGRRAIWDIPVPIDLLVYYPDEVAERRDALGSIVKEALRTGKVVFGHV